MVKHDVESRLSTHEEVCAIRYEQINARLKRLEQILLATAGFVIVFLLSQSYAHADTTTINNKGMPVPSALPPQIRLLRRFIKQTLLFVLVHAGE